MSNLDKANRAGALQQRWLRFRRQPSIRTKIFLGVILPLTFAVSTVILFQYFRHRATLLSNLSNFSQVSAEVVEENLLHEMMEADGEGVQRLIDSIALREEFQAIKVLKPTGEIAYAPDGNGVGSMLSIDGPTCQTCHTLPDEELPESILVTDENDQHLVRMMLPIENGPSCSECHGTQDDVIGLVLMDIAPTPMITSMVGDLRENLVWGLTTLLIAIFVVTLGLNKLFLPHWPAREGESVLADQTLFYPFSPVGETIRTAPRQTAPFAWQPQWNSLNGGALSPVPPCDNRNPERRELLKGIITAQENERKRVARDLHDELGQILSGLSLQVEGVKRLLETDPSRAMEQLDQLRSLAAAGTEQMYNIILDLRPSALDDLGLVPALRIFAERQLASTDLTLHLEADPELARLPADIETALFRVFQEGLNNVVRHANASQVWFVLSCVDGVFHGEIRDNGRGFDPDAIQLVGRQPCGLGIMGMQERVNQCGGRLTVWSKIGQGTTLKIILPLPEAPHD